MKPLPEYWDIVLACAGMHAEASGGFGEQRITAWVRVKDARPDEDILL